MSIVIQPTYSNGPYGQRISYFLPVTVNGVAGNLLVDTAENVSDVVLTKLTSKIGKPESLGKMHTLPYYKAEIQIADSEPFIGNMTLAADVESEEQKETTKEQDGIVSGEAVTRRYNMFFSGNDKTLTLTPVAKPFQTDDPLHVAKHLSKFIIVPMQLNGVPLLMNVDSGGSNYLAELTSPVIAKIGQKQVEKSGKVNITLGGKTISVPVIPAPGNIDILGIPAFLQLASLYVTRYSSIVMDYNKQPILPPVNGPMADGFVALVNKNPTVSFWVIGMLFAIAFFIVYRKKLFRI